MDLSINIPDSKAKAFIEFLKTIDFVKIKTKEPMFEFSPEQKRELDSRIKDYQANPSTCLDWDTVKTQIESRF